MSEELKPCPFCGSTDLEVNHRECDVIQIHAEGYCVECCNCGITQTLYNTTPDDAIRTWNRRANADEGE